MGLRSELQEALPDMFEAAGEAAVFTPAAGDPIPCQVFIDFNQVLEPDGYEGMSTQRGTIIEALLSDIGREPNRDETFTVDGVIYRVARPIANDGFTVKIAVKI